MNLSGLQARVAIGWQAEVWIGASYSQQPSVYSRAHQVLLSSTRSVAGFAGCLIGVVPLCSEQGGDTGANLVVAMETWWHPRSAGGAREDTCPIGGEDARTKEDTGTDLSHALPSLHLKDTIPQCLHPGDSIPNFREDTDSSGREPHPGILHADAHSLHPRAHHPG